MNFIQGSRKWLALLAAVLASLTMSVSTISLVSASSVETARPTAEDLPAGDGTVTSSVEVPPWCSWYLNGGAAAIGLSPDEGEQYVGEDLLVRASSADMYAYIGSEADEVAKMDEENCSWFGATPWNAEFTVELDTLEFEATTASLVRDTAMDFSVSVDKPISITPTFSDACDVSFTEGPASALPIEPDPGTDGMTANVWTNNSGGTNDFCTFSFAYQVTIPGGLIPSYGGTTYTWAGPSITHKITITDPDE